MTIKINKDELHELYFVQRMTKKQIAEHYECSEKVIDKRFQWWGWKFRKCGEMVSTWMKINSKLYGEIEKIKKLYLGHNTCKEIGKLYGVSESAIATFLKNNNVQLRQLTEAQVNRIQIDEDSIYDLYVNKKQSCVKIAQKHQCNEETVRKTLVNYDIERRNKSEWIKNNCTGARYILKHGSDEEKEMLKEKISKSHQVYFEEDIDKIIIHKNLFRLSKIKNSKVLLKCLNDGFEWLSSIGHIVSGRGCPICKHKSQKETFVCLHNILSPTTITHPHKLTTYRWEKKDRNLLVDFYFEHKEREIVVEYQGEQHYVPVRFNGIPQEVAEKNFKRQVHRDNVLREFCKSNNVILIEIDGRIHNIYKNNIRDFLEQAIKEII